jgi:hypothetical protein
MRSLSRVAVAVVALLLIGWFAVLARDSAIGTDATNRLHHHPDMSAARWDDSLDQLRRATFLNPGDDWTVRRAAYLILRDRDEALRVAEDVVRRQPDFLESWVVIYNATREDDPVRAAQAARQIRRLAPATADR